MFSNIKILLYISNFLQRKYWVVHEVCFSEIILVLMYRECGLLMCEWHAVRWVFLCKNCFSCLHHFPFSVKKKLFKMSSFCFSFYSPFISLVSHSSCLLCWIKNCQGSYGWLFFPVFSFINDSFPVLLFSHFLLLKGVFYPRKLDMTKQRILQTLRSFWFFLAIHVFIFRFTTIRINHLNGVGSHRSNSRWENSSA